MSIVITHPLALMPYDETEITVINLATEHQIEEIPERTKAYVLSLRFLTKAAYYHLLMQLPAIGVSEDESDQEIRVSSCRFLSDILIISSSNDFTTGRCLTLFPFRDSNHVS